MHWFLRCYEDRPEETCSSGFFKTKEVREVKRYVGNLSYATDSGDLRGAVEKFGTVDSAEVVTDRNTNRSRGFGFVEMSNESEAKAAISGLNGREMDGRTLKVSEAKPRTTEARSGYRF